MGASFNLSCWMRKTYRHISLKNQRPRCLTIGSKTVALMQTSFRVMFFLSPIFAILPPEPVSQSVVSAFHDSTTAAIESAMFGIRGTTPPYKAKWLRCQDSKG